MNEPETAFPIVGIGASAGGIRAMETLFKAMPHKPGAAFVIVTHLNPDQESALHEIIGRYTELPVHVAEHGVRVEVDHVYVMPSNVILTITDGCLHQREPNAIIRERKPVDIFFSSLAEDQGEYAVAMILSGGDGDGTLGAKVVKEYGGLTLAQTPSNGGPQDPGMPESAIASGVVDVAIPVEQMGERVLAYSRSFDALATISHEESRMGEARLNQVRQEIYALLRDQSRHDFSGYKTKTFMRRIRRRMHVLKQDRLEGYVEVLKQNPDEVMNLFRDLLINVTNFFRDPDAFEALERLVIPKLFEGRGAGDTVRIWVPACATGEEVYSIAILMRERMDAMPNPPRVQIFATDIADTALSVARAARYPEPLLDGLTPERKKRFFNMYGDSYVLRGEVRELCIFSPHSIIRDPPFSRMDLVSCRNLLIYLGPEVQNQVIPMFHYALKPGGFMFLGISESISQHVGLFEPVDKKSRIFQARDHGVPGYRLPLMLGDPKAPAQGADRREGSRAASHSLRQAAEMQVLEKFAPAHVIVDDDGNVVYYSPRTGTYLEPPQGAPSRQILAMARKGLRLDLQLALRQAVATRTAVQRDSSSVVGNGIEPVRLVVEPLADRGNGERLYLVLFTPMGPARIPTEVELETPASDTATSFEQELRETRERLQSTIEEYETVIEELKSANEELVSVNEEAQSTNEELEASKEETQSLNEELNTINAELNGKLDELDRANGDLRNLFESSRIATVFLDRNLVIRNFTPAASSFFNLRKADIGRPLTDLSSTLDYPDLKTHIDSVFNTGDMLEHQLARDAQGKHFLVRLLPYRNDGGSTDGVVVTLIDVTRLAEADEHQQVLISELNHRVKNMLTVVISITKYTAEHAPTQEAFTSALTGRLYAMARTYTLLSQSNWKEASVGELVAREVEPFDAARFTCSGPDIRLKPQPGVSLGMVLHELATNATKYGALSQEGGRVSVIWSKESGTFVLHWTETGGPPVTEPDQEGFGLFLIKGEIAYRLSGKAETWFEPDGFQIRLSFEVGT